MHARITTVRVRPASAPDIERGWRELLEPYRASGAFHGMISLHSPSDDVAVTLTLWASAEAADAVVGPLRQRALELFADVVIETPQIIGYDVLLADLGTGLTHD